MADHTPTPLPPKVKDRTGLTYNSLLVLRFGGLTVQPNGRRLAKWVCRCLVCGSTTVVLGNHLHTGHIKSCGCKRPRHSRKPRKHGMSHHPTYQSWTSMWSRCSNEKDTGWKRYGGRGIRVCDRWREFENFLAGMGERPPGHSLERRDNEGDYEPNNTRWATPAEQAKNTRWNVCLSYAGRTMCLSDWARETALKDATLRKRIRRLGWSVEKAITTPVKSYANGS